MRLIIAGGRDFNDYILAYRTLDNLLSNTPCENIVILCGKARGGDTVGEQYALDHGIKIEYYIPDWDGIGKKAGIIRNMEMGDSATHLVAFWDGKSKGTKHMIDYATKKGLQVRVIKY